MCGHAGGRYLQLAALLRQKNQHASLILLRVALPADNAGFSSRFRSWLSVPESSRTRAPSPETVRPYFSRSISSTKYCGFSRG